MLQNPVQRNSIDLCRVFDPFVAYKNVERERETERTP